MTSAFADHLEAIRAGEIPGAFGPGRLSFALPQIRYTDARGARRYWGIAVQLFAGEAGPPLEISDEMLEPGGAVPPGAVGVTLVRSGAVGGKLRDAVPTFFAAGKNAGRRNATNALTQALRDAVSKHNAQLRRVASANPSLHNAEETADDSAEAAASDSESAVGDSATVASDSGSAAGGPARPPPMLLTPIEKAPISEADFEQGVTVQRKLDGVRVVAAPEEDGRVVFYSRTGLEYGGLAQLQSEVRRLAAHAPGAPERRPFFDGELYLHGKPLNWISGQARRADDDSTLEYHVFDVFFPAEIARNENLPSAARQEYLDAAFAAATAAEGPLAHVRRVENERAGSRAELDAIAKRYLSEGYEGAVARLDGRGYQFSVNGYHSRNVLKVKPTFTDEFPIVGIAAGEGKDAGALIWVCEVPEGEALDAADRRFSVVPIGITLESRKRLYACLAADEQARFRRDALGRPLTVRYASRSAKTGKPLQAKGVAIRTYEGPGADAVSALYADCGVE